jgi:hypothetical protein
MMRKESTNQATSHVDPNKNEVDYPKVESEKKSEQRQVESKKESEERQVDSEARQVDQVKSTKVGSTKGAKPTKRKPSRSVGGLGGLRMTIGPMKKGSRLKRKAQSEWVDLWAKQLVKGRIRRPTVKGKPWKFGFSNQQLRGKCAGQI